MGHPVLRAPALPVDPSELGTPALQQLIDDMLETMTEYQGVGLAGPQVHQSRRLFVALVDDGDDPLPLTILVNPELTLLGDAQVDNWEGCLSIPEVRGRVPRAPEVEVRALDRHGQRIHMTARGLAARVIQHETDHLDGILFPDRMRSFESLTFTEEFTRYWSRESH